MIESQHSPPGKRMPTLSVFLNQPFYCDGESYFSPNPQPADLFLAIADQFTQLRICVPMSALGTAIEGVRISLPDNVTMIALPVYTDESQLVKMLPRFYPAVRKVARAEAKIADIVGYVSPSVAGVAFARAAKSKPQFELVRGNKKLTLAGIHRTFPIGQAYGLAIRMLNGVTGRLRRRRRPVTLVYGQQLVDLFPEDESAAVIPITDGVPGWVEAGVSGAARPSQDSEDGVFNILYVGRVSGEKGIDALITATGELAKILDRDVRLTIVGDGPEMPNLREQAASLGILNRVTFTGRINSGAPLLSKYLDADVFVLPSHTEGAPRVLLEAMALDVPAVATAIGGIPWLVNDGKAALLVRPDDPTGLAVAIKRVATEEGLADSLIARGLEVAEEHSLAAEGERVMQGLHSAFPQLFGE
ncbi:MAG: glycosyltransferase [Phycisphaerae bacterium]|nr:glycosyltransferase [Phycisphaerae bacterium]